MSKGRAKKSFCHSSIWALYWSGRSSCRDWIYLAGPDRYFTWLTPLAALGILPIMIGALVSHLRQKDWPQAGFCLLLIVLLTFVAVMRAFVMPL
ncbi:MAG: DoxX family protein [Ktedonobacteraceae bacterium]